MLDNITNLSLAELRAKLDVREISAPELAAHYQKRISATNQTLNSFITQNEAVEKQAQHAQKEIEHGNAGPLTGIPYAAKDNFCTQGLKTTAGSKILAEYIPPYSATAVKRCTDAVLLGKTNMDEFAMGVSNEYSAFGPVRNPYDLERVPGGTSGGSAAAVAAGQAAFALGTDTGGSVRQPACFCNVVGLRPTYGRISRYGVIAMASSFDTVGILARTVEDVAYVLKELAGPDGFDATVGTAPVPDYRAQLADPDMAIKGLRVGIPKEWQELEGMDPQIQARYEECVHELQELGMQVTEISLPNSKYSLATYYILVPSEVSSNLARYDGIQFGRPAPEAANLDEVFMKTRAQGFGVEVKRRIMIGTFCLSAGYIDAYYKKAQRVRTLIKEDFVEAFRQVDVIFAPTSPIVPFKLGERSRDPLAMYLADILTAPASAAGIPAISVPAGFVQGLPVGMQFMAAQFQEAVLLKAAHAFERGHNFPQCSLIV